MQKEEKPRQYVWKELFCCPRGFLLLGSSFPSLRPPSTTSKTLQPSLNQSNSSSQRAHTQPPFPLPTPTGAMAEDDDTQQSKAACRVAQGTLAWLTGGVKGEGQGYLVGHAAFPSRSFPDVLGALAKRPGSGTWKEDKQARHAGAGVVYHREDEQEMWSREDEQEMWSWGVLLCTPLAAYSHTDTFTTSRSQNRSSSIICQQAWRSLAFTASRLSERWLCTRIWGCRCQACSLHVPEAQSLFRTHR